MRIFLPVGADETDDFDVVAIGSSFSIFSIVSQKLDPISGIPPPERSKAIRSNVES